MKKLLILVLLANLMACAAHQSYDTARFRQHEVQYKRVTLNEGGLTAEQIKTISSTKPPKDFPVDVAVLIIKNGYIDIRLEEMFAYDLVQGLKKSKKIGRVTPIPDFLIPENVSFNTIQELGVRCLSEYVLVFYIDASEFFRWTAIVANKYEVNSSVSYILVDSGTSAMLTSDRLHSTKEYRESLFSLEEQEKAQKEIFSEQGKLLSKKIDDLFDKQ